MKAAIVRAADRKEFRIPEGCHILELWNAEEGGSLSVARARVEPGVTTAFHTVSVCERYLIVEGRGLVDVEGLPPAEVGPGDLVAIPPGSRQRIRNLGAGDLLFYCLCTPRFTPDCYRATE